MQKHANSAAVHRLEHKWFYCCRHYWSLQELQTSTPPPSSTHSEYATHTIVYHYPWTDSLLFGRNLRDMTNAFITVSKKKKRNESQRVASLSLLAKVWEQMLLECSFFHFVFINCTFRCAVRMCSPRRSLFFLFLQIKKKEWKTKRYEFRETENRRSETLRAITTISSSFSLVLSSYPFFSSTSKHPNGSNDLAIRSVFRTLLFFFGYS